MARDAVSCTNSPCPIYQRVADLPSSASWICQDGDRVSRPLEECTAHHYYSPSRPPRGLHAYRERRDLRVEGELEDDGRVDASSHASGRSSALAASARIGLHIVERVSRSSSWCIARHNGCRLIETSRSHTHALNSPEYTHQSRHDRRPPTHPRGTQNSHKAVY